MRLRATASRRVPSRTFGDEDAAAQASVGELGALLVEDGKLRPEDIDVVLSKQQDQGLRFGEAAVRAGLVTDADVSAALARQFRFALLRPGDPRVSPSVLTAFEPDHSVARALRFLRSQLLLHWGDNAIGRALAVVGASRFEGRSFLTANLAVVFAQLGARTLIIDGDLRNPVQHKLFRLSNRDGLSTMVSGRHEEHCEYATALPRLFVMPAGPTPPNPEELLSQDGFSALVRQMRTIYDVTLVDTPAAGIGSDAQLIASAIGNSLITARKHRARVAAVRHLVEQLNAGDVKVLGSVLNEVPQEMGRL